MNKILKSAREAVAVAKGEIPAARITIQGHTYVPLAECELLRDALKPFAEQATVTTDGKYRISTDRPRSAITDIIRARRVYDGNR